MEVSETKLLILDWEPKFLFCIFKLDALWLVMRHMRTMTIWLLDAIKPDTTHQV